jgi:hypothetical protein
MKRFIAMGSVLCVVALAAAQPATDKDVKLKVTVKVIVLVEAKDQGLSPESKIKQIDLDKETSGKREVKAKVEGKDKLRLNGIYIVKQGAILLDGGKKLPKQEILLATEVGNQPLQNPVFLQTCEIDRNGQPTTWLAFRAECALPEDTRPKKKESK